MSTTNPQNPCLHTRPVDSSAEQGQLPAEEMGLLGRMAARIASLRSLAPDIAQLSLMA